MAALNDALTELTDDDRRAVRLHLERWKSGGDWNWERVALNIEGETALGRADFVRLLRAWADALRGGAEAAEAWRTACRGGQLQGPALARDRTPGIVGRAMALRDYARLVSVTTKISETQAQQLLHEVILAGHRPSRRASRILRRAPVGRYVVWATFDVDAPDSHPYADIVRTTGFIRTAFGLGHCRSTEILALIAYRARSERLELRRPTIADAESYPWYRPCASGDRHGWTEPLPPNPDALPRQPEVVHPEVMGRGLVFPLYSTR